MGSKISGVPDNSYIIWSKQFEEMDSFRDSALETLKENGVPPMTINSLPYEQTIQSQVREDVKDYLDDLEYELDIPIDDSVVRITMKYGRTKEYIDEMSSANLNACIEDIRNAGYCGTLYVDADGRYLYEESDYLYEYRQLKPDLSYNEREAFLSGEYDITPKTVEKYTDKLGEEAAKALSFAIGISNNDYSVDNTEPTPYVISDYFVPAPEGSIPIYSSLFAVTDTARQQAEDKIASENILTGAEALEDVEKLIGDTIRETQKEQRHDAMGKLNITTKGEVIGILQDGGYHMIGDTISYCIQILEEDYSGYNTFYVDKHGDFCAEDEGDITVFRELKPELSNEQVWEFKELLISGKPTAEQIDMYTNRLGDSIAKAYGKTIDEPARTLNPPPAKVSTMKEYDYNIPDGAHLLWSDDMISDPEIRRECIEIMEENDEPVTERDIENWMNNNFGLMYDVARQDLDIEVGEIICIGDIGHWDGRVRGYKDNIGTHISDCLSYHVDGVRELTVYMDKHGDLRARESHHDGCNYYLYRVLKDTLSDRQIENFKEKLYNGNYTQADINRYTRRLGDDIVKVYNWEIPKHASKATKNSERTD